MSARGQLAFHVDSSTCIGCKTCQVACQDKNDLAADIVFRRVLQYGGGTWLERTGGHTATDVFLYFLSLSCQHCEDPACVKVCPTTAMRKDRRGIVSVDRDRCVGCRRCERNCPYGAPQYDADAGVMTKCDFCRDLLDLGQEPVCVSACVTRSLAFGELDDLRQRYGSLASIAPLPLASLTHPALVITPHRKAQPTQDGTGRVLNLPEELR